MRIISKGEHHGPQDVSQSQRRWRSTDFVGAVRGTQCCSADPALGAFCAGGSSGEHGSQAVCGARRSPHRWRDQDQHLSEQRAGVPPEQAQQIKLGTIDMGLPTQGQLDKYDTAFAAVMLPFVFDSPEHVFRVLDGSAMTWLAPLAEKQGFILLHNWEYGFRNVTNSVRPIHTPDDVKGLKLRTPPELQIQ